MKQSLKSYSNEAKSVNKIMICVSRQNEVADVSLDFSVSLELSFSATRIDKFDVEDKVETLEPVILVVKQPAGRRLYCDARFGICILRERSDRKVIFSWDKTRVGECEKRNSMELTSNTCVSEFTLTNSGFRRFRYLKEMVHIPNALFWVFVAETKKNVNPLKKQATDINKGTIAEVAEEEEHKEGMQFTIDRRSDEGSRSRLCK
ncbi:hypothetical protein Tco_0394891 [Tanacetum coccineum]